MHMPSMDADHNLVADGIDLHRRNCDDNENPKKRCLTLSYAFGQSDASLLGMTVADVLEQAVQECPNQLAFVVSHQRIRRTFVEFHQEVECLAAGLVALGLQQGDRIGIWGPNSYEWIVTQFAAATAGLILVNINPAYQPAELLYCLKKVECRAIIAARSFRTQDYYAMLCRIIPEIRSSSGNEAPIRSKQLPFFKLAIIISDQKLTGTLTFNEVMQKGFGEDRTLLQSIKKRVQFDNPVNIQFTSGTTGSPKGATLSHHNVVNNAFLIGRRLLDRNQKARICVPVPLYHCFGCVIGTMLCVIHKATCVIPAAHFNAESTLDSIHMERCTHVYGTPTMYVDMLGKLEEKPRNLSCLHKSIMSGSTCPIELLQTVKRRMGIKEIFIPYGMTENSPVVTLTSSSDPIEKQINTVGKPLDFVEIKIMDDDGRTAPIGVHGELCTRGHPVFLGYWNDKLKTQEIISSARWCHTGDLAKMDEDGYITIVGRLKDMINRGGENIYPREIEEFFYTHSAVDEIQVVGVPDKRLGEEICAWIRLKPGYEDITEDDMRNYCRGKISHFKIPRYVLFVKDYPKTVTGKIQKYKMREASIHMLNLKD